MEHILEVAAQFGKVYGIIGGFHSNRIEPLNNLKLICPAHWTRYKKEIKQLYPRKYVEAGAAKIITI